MKFLKVNKITKYIVIIYYDPPQSEFKFYSFNKILLYSPRVLSVSIIYGLSHIKKFMTETDSDTTKKITNINIVDM